jgi:hypothetical protein
MPSVRRRRLLAPLVLLLGIVSIRNDALARDTDKSWEFGAYVPVSRYAAATDIDTGVGFGVRGGYHLTATHVIEGSFDSVSADQVNQTGVKFDVQKFNVDYVRVLFVKGHEKMTPFATFGVGAIDIDDGTKTGSSTAYRAGGGFKFFLKPRIGFRFDVKIYRWHGDGKVLMGRPYFAMDATFGATFLFGGAK